MTLRSAKSFDVSQTQVPQCNKETVGKMRLQKWTRGILAIVNSGGHIIYWSPLYKSEGPAQVAVIVLNFLFSVLAMFAEGASSMFAGEAKAMSAMLTGGITAA